MENLKGHHNIAVAGTGYVGLSLAVLLAQHNKVTAVDIIQQKVDLINKKKSPIQDDYIEKYLTDKELDLNATMNAAEAIRMQTLLSLRLLPITIAKHSILIRAL